jgi:hypothetical protein
MAEPKTSKETYRHGTLQSVKDAKTGSKKSSKSPNRSGTLQSVREASGEKKVSKPKDAVRDGKKEGSK